MKTFWTVNAVTFFIVVALVALALLPVPVYSRADTAVSSLLLRTLRKDELNREAREAQTAGYYEGLLNEGSRVAGMNALVTGNERFTPESWMRPGRRHRGDFLYWDMPPNVNARDPENPRFDLKTNSHGLADMEYTLAKPAGTRRIALLGDSITRGQGAPFGTNYEFLLEERLNREFFGSGGGGLEIVNFAVGGYRITQLLDVAKERVPAFSPDVYVLPLSELSVFRNWGDHVATLVQNGVDLKYDYLKRMVRQADLRPSDPSATITAKMARFRLPTVRWVLEEVKNEARRHDAELVVLLLANGSDPETLEEQFAGVRDLLDKLSIPYIDVLDAFVDVDDPTRYRVSDSNTHPNELGHRRLFEQLHAKIVGNRTFFNLVVGPDVPWSEPGKTR